MVNRIMKKGRIIVLNLTKTPKSPEEKPTENPIMKTKIKLKVNIGVLFIKAIRDQKPLVMKVILKIN